ncbi:MAG: DUF1840 domain-containing protein [Burkholderiaceae bacterium]|nr:DUF1840 domain-containing protein [Burkholderiaceae bacterium]
MLYKFKSPATGDLVMLGPHGDALLRVLGREPAPRGIIEPAAMAQAIQALRQAVADDEARRAQALLEAEAATAQGQETAAPAEAPGLRQRLWPMLQMLERARAADEPITWGV